MFCILAPVRCADVNLQPLCKILVAPQRVILKLEEFNDTLELRSKWGENMKTTSAGCRRKKCCW